MTQQFHAGQEVEVYTRIPGAKDFLMRGWYVAKIVRLSVPALQLRVSEPERYEVQFPDNSRAVFDAEHIRPVDSPARASAKKVAHDFGEALMGRRS